MADFQKAYAITMKNEGGYSNDRDDHGGETWRGIARNFWPGWAGWSIIDALKATRPLNLDHTLSAHPELEDLVLSFYKENFWDALKLDLLAAQPLGNQLFDIAVNMGTGTGTKFLQEAINQIAETPIAADGKIGPLTIAAAQKIEVRRLYDGIKELRRARYEQIIAHNPGQAKFKASWLSRLKPFDAPENQ